MTLAAKMGRLGDLLNRNSTIALGSLWSTLIKFGSAALSYVMFVLFAKAMDPVEFGQFSLAFSLGSFLAIVASAGLHTAILRWIPEYSSTGRVAVAGYALRWSMRMTLLVGVVVSLAVTAAVMAIWVGRPVPGFMLAMIALILPLAMAEFVGSALRATGSVIFSQLPRDILWRGIAILMAGYFALNGEHMTSTFAILFLAVSLTLLIAPQMLSSRRSVPVAASGDETDGLARAWLSQLPPMWGIAVLYASTQYIDTVIVGHFVSTEMAGAYFSASRTALLVSLMLVASVMVTAPLISSAFHSNDTLRLQQVLRFAALCTLIPTLSFVVLLVVIGRPLLEIFDPAFSVAYPALVVLVIGQAINALSGPMSYVLQLTGHGTQNFKIIAGCYIVGLITQLALIPQIGMIGAAIGSSGAIIAWNIISWRYVTKRLKVDPTVLSLLRRKADKNT
jgi:O-antigen/teichoic acid export membrane protein